MREKRRGVRDAGEREGGGGGYTQRETERKQSGNWQKQKEK